MTRIIKYNLDDFTFTVLKRCIDVSLSGKGDSVSYMIHSIAESVDRSNLSNVIQIPTQDSESTHTPTLKHIKAARQ